ncbi:MAG: glyoxylate/hydroxypyruvate reductase A [Ahrensia sp.]|nr:glyoxylate/hydroxypyruvate reductase A [Ahrensia sp.]
MSGKTVLLDLKHERQRKFELFRQCLPDHEIIDIETGLSDAQRDRVAYAAVWAPEPGLLAGLPSLEVIFSSGAGVDHVFADPHLPDKPLVRFVDPDLTGRMVEWVVLQCLIHLRQQRRYDASQRARKWDEAFQPAAHEVTVGIMGFGELGQAAASALLPLGFQLRGWSRSKKVMEGVEIFGGKDELDGFLGGTDFLVSLLPYTTETHGVLNRDLFSKLRHGRFDIGPVLINAGRGKSQVEEDIAEALRDGTLAGASLDVFETEPLPQDSALWDFDNLIITPHNAAVSDAGALAHYVARQIRNYEAGQPLENVVDRSRGY